jgi:hypothetical protein
MNKEFEVHMLNARGKVAVTRAAEAFDDCLNTLIAVCPVGRELSIARTKLEEACFFAKKSLANNPENCGP